ncbi:hypothetical protein N658DRAFT_498047 [Parathielavia hyrcaniae]|uniref:Uncharacterized protein n=1 Tax=Parathielavia hyrcaniae TaxID=113614 RepID=A0AAN6PZ69_9PEZI|nr:hypothetical protein N658DRAFT_498047 [Parathielavia hyrcaniae]
MRGSAAGHRGTRNGKIEDYQGRKKTKEAALDEGWMEDGSWSGGGCNTQTAQRLHGITDDTEPSLFTRHDLSQVYNATATKQQGRPLLASTTPAGFDSLNHQTATGISQACRHTQGLPTNMVGPPWPAFWAGPAARPANMRNCVLAPPRGRVLGVRSRA